MKKFQGSLSALFVSAFLLISGSLSAQNFVITDTIMDGAYGNAVWGDFDGDGWMDLAYGAQSITVGAADSMHIYHNTGSGFEKVAQYFPYYPNSGMAAADLNGDGKAELIYSGYFAENTVVYTSNGAGGFDLLSDIHLPATATGNINVMDYNNDGVPDLFISGFDTSGARIGKLFKGGPGLTFTEVSTSIVGFVGGQSKWGDYDNDGKPDLITVGEDLLTNDVMVYKNMGADSFLLTATFPHRLETVDWIDYNEDGFLDFLITGFDFETAHNHTLLYKSDGAGGFAMDTLSNLPDFGEPAQVAIADFNLDGHTDIFLTGGSDMPLQKTVLALGTGTATFLLDTTFLETNHSNCIVRPQDFNNDGRPDLFLNNLFVLNLGSTSVAHTANEMAGLQVYPNPGTDRAIIQWTAAAAKPALITVTDVAGRLILQQNVPQQMGSNQVSLDLHQAPNGIYFLQVAAAGIVQTGHWVKK